MSTKVGIHDLAFQAPSLFLSIEDLAEARGIEADKLKFGLGLEAMSLCDLNEDVVTLASGAILKLLKQNPDITPDQIGRIYVGTESSIDGSKPIGSYIHDIVNQHFNGAVDGPNVLVNTDVVDMTFACIGAVDAMHNSLYYVQAETDKLAIVVAADIANYDLDSSGEYTQGAGAVAVLLGANPRLLVINNKWGVATKSEHDFFKPIRLTRQENLTITLHDEKPIFDGQFSNQTYQNRITEAWSHLSSKNAIWSAYDQLIFHLPYAFHGRRIVTSIVEAELLSTGELQKICETNDIDVNNAERSKLFAKTKPYKDWVKAKISAGEKLSSQMGNLYTASIFLGLMSSLEFSNPLSGSNILFFAYGSGSKAKAFEGVLVPGFESVVSAWKSVEMLNTRKQVTFNQYIDIRMQQLERPIASSTLVQQTSSGISDTNRYARKYELMQQK
jgi:hydroxymethylglutaryl-CoA synthase